MKSLYESDLVHLAGADRITTEQKIAPNEIVPVEIEILPSSTRFEAGTSVRLDIQGGDAARYPAFAHRHTVNRGTHRIHCGGRFDSQLLIPLVGAPGANGENDDRLHER